MIGKTIFHYHILAKLGEGGMGVVYKARDTRLDRLVALKFLPPHTGEDSEEKKRFIHEAKAASALDHPNICSVYEINQTPDGRLFIAMGYYEGKTLREKIKGEQLSIGEAVAIAIQIAEGLKKAHAKGIVHRDMKPANVMLAEEEAVKIVDFGLAKLKGLTKITRTGTTLGTVAYMSPEQAGGGEVDQRTDLWSLGVMLYEMLTGTLPFKGEYEQAVIYAILNEDPTSISKIRSDIPENIKRIIRRALSKNPADRYQTASDLIRDLKRFQASVKATETMGLDLKHLLWRPKVMIPTTIVLVAIILAGFIFFKHRAKARWAKNELLPRISRLVAERIGEYFQVFQLAEEAERIIPHDPGLRDIFSKISVRSSILTDPPGARVYIKNYNIPESAWKFIGLSPVERFRLPIGFIQIRMEMEGYETVWAASTTYNFDMSKNNIYVPLQIKRKLDKRGSLPPGMVRIPGGMIEGIGRIGDFYMDRYEVTNRQFREFVGRGGYRKPEYWQHKFIENGRELTWKEAMGKFVDQTGRPGPAGWMAGDYPEGQDDYPVGGVSWYEAAAYAEFVGKTLPTAYHWGASCEINEFRYKYTLGDFFIPQCNFKGEGPERVGNNPAISAHGQYDMGGNVREWCGNETLGSRILRGGSWTDAPYMFMQISQQSPFDRSAQNGFRCVEYLDMKKIPIATFQVMTITGMPDLYKMHPVSDEVFKIYRDQFAYDKRDLNSRLEWRDDTSQDWIQEKITFDAAYENERVPVFLFLPRNSSPPYQTIIYFPGHLSRTFSSSKNLKAHWDFRWFPPWLKSGRAVLFPIYKGTFERGSPVFENIHARDLSHQYTEFFKKVVKDFKRSIDYLETRPDINCTKLAYVGASWGGNSGAIILALDDRIMTSVLISAGIEGIGRSEVNEINYVTRVRIPTLMLNGRYDMRFPLETSCKPMFDLLGTPPSQKELKLYNTDHMVPFKEVIRESLDWFDRYLGPVK